MKKIIPLFLIFIFIFCGCNNSEKNSLENKSWSLSRIIQTQTDIVVFASEKESSKYNTAKALDLSCTADESKITIKDNSSGNEWSLDYIINKTAETNNTEGAVYDITFTAEDKTVKGYASTGIANTDETGGNNYLVITIDGYELHFINIPDSLIL